MQAALIYQHATREAGMVIARSMDAQVEAARAKAEKGSDEANGTATDDSDGDPDDGAAGVLVPVA